MHVVYIFDAYYAIVLAYDVYNMRMHTTSLFIHVVYIRMLACILHIWYGLSAYHVYV